MPIKKVVYNGTAYTLGTTGRYYYGTKKQKTVALHRQTWIDHNGPIPEGYHIHHKDGNVFNNSIDNLECIEPWQHWKLHWDKDKEFRMPYLLALAETGREYAKEWHGSHTGRQWHRNHYEEMKDRLHQTYNRKCSFCGKDVATQRKSRNCFCSGYCKTQFRYKSGVDDEIRICPTCSQSFSVNKYRKVIYCSRSCAQQARSKENPAVKRIAGLNRKI